MTDTLARLAAIGPVAADPYPWPYDGTVATDRVALICIDWQVDFCGRATELGNHTAALRMVTMQGGVFGCVATSEAVVAATSTGQADGD